MYNNLGIVLEEQRLYRGAATAYEQAVSHQRQAVESPENARYREFLSKHYVNLARVLRQSAAWPHLSTSP